MQSPSTGRTVSAALGQARAATPRRGREGAAKLGSGMSPKVKRPVTIAAPPPAAAPVQMTGDEMVGMLHELKAQQEQMAIWANSVNESLNNHADGPEGAHKEFVMLRGELHQSHQAADEKTESIAQRLSLIHI